MKTESSLTASLIKLAEDPAWKSAIQFAGGLLLLILILGVVFFALTGIGLPIGIALIFAIRSVILILKKI